MKWLAIFLGAVLLIAGVEYYLVFKSISQVCEELGYISSLMRPPLDEISPNNPILKIVGLQDRARDNPEFAIRYGTLEKSLRKIERNCPGILFDSVWWADQITYK